MNALRLNGKKRSTNCAQGYGQDPNANRRGTDESACAVFEDGQFKRVLGRAVYEIVVTDFETKTYRMTERDSGFA